MDKKTKKDYLSYTLLFQLIVCISLFGILLGLKEINSDIYLMLKSEYINNLNENFDAFDEFSTANTENTVDKTASNAVAETTNQTQYNETKENTEQNLNKEIKSLNVEIQGAGGQDYKINKIDEVPANVSVNTYTLNQRMVVPVNGTVTSNFGVRNHPISNELRFHAGIDIAADTGTPIYSAFDGVVAEVKYDKWNGNYLKIQHESEITTVYCHCDEIIVKKGDKINAGEIVARVGSTGASTGPHLHFEFRVDNISYDPQTALNKAVNAV